MGILAELFITSAEIGLFTFGGGYAMISMTEGICSERKGWISHEEMMDITMIAESTPGPIAINCATFVGYKQKGLTGALAATIGIVFPSFAIIYLIALLIDSFLEITVIANAVKGIRIAAGILILGAGFNMIRKMKKSIMMCASALFILIASFSSVRISSVSLMPASGAISLALTELTEIKRKKASDDSL